MNSSALKQLEKKYRENKLAHAYLIETNDINLATQDLKELIKILNCPQTYQKVCTNCNLCNLIVKNNLPSLKLIQPDGSSIKKSQIEELKNDFNTIPIYSKFNVYIIQNAEKLNSSSANSMLKFLEEPTPGILGFFLTTNKDVMMDTIKSRCQSLILTYETKNLKEILNISEETYDSYKKIIKIYLSELERNILINNKKLILTSFKERKDIENIMKIIFEIYYNHFLKGLGKSYNEDITQIYNINDNLATINKKMQIISTILNNMSYNVNIELILDKFVIEMRGTNE